VEEKVLGGKKVVQVVRSPEVQPSRGTRPFWNNKYQGGFYRAPRGEFSGGLRRREGGGQKV